MSPDPNVLRRSEPCAQCGEMMLWTQNAWAHGENRAAAYQCTNGHVIDPATTHGCPVCGLHDTRMLEPATEPSEIRACNACGARFGDPPAYTPTVE